MHWSGKRQSCISRSNLRTPNLRTSRPWPWVAHGLRITAGHLFIIDLRTTSFTAASVITIFQTCPLLKELDVGECPGVLELARLLEEEPRERLVVRLLKHMEVCESGDGDNWIGYRPKLRYRGSGICVPRERGYLSVTQYGGKTQKVGPPASKLQHLKLKYQLGSPHVLPAVRAVEAIVQAIQQPTSPFCMHVNGCEECLQFAQHVSYDGKGSLVSYDGKTYGQHTCMLCKESRFLCLDCVGHSYHYCAEEECDACICVKCDGGRSVIALLASGRENLLGECTTHFKIVECCWKHTGQCRFPKEDMILCKDKKACCKDPRDPDWAYGPNLCPTCGKWQCGWCNDNISCQECDVKPCATNSSIEIKRCDNCSCDLCNTCGPVRDCEDGCEPERLGDTTYKVSHCPECYSEIHPSVDAAAPGLVAATA